MKTIVEPTVPFEAAARQPWEVIVVGAGPAGALAARELARSGVKVLLVDKAAFPRWKVCGACLNPWGLNSLAKVGLGDLPGRLGAVPLKAFLLASDERRATLRLPGSAALSREALDAELVQEAIRAGAAFLPETRAALGQSTKEDRALILRHDEDSLEARTNLVLAADGLGGRIAMEDPTCESIVSEDSRVGAGTVAASAPAFYAPGTIYMACGPGSYVGLVRLEDNRLNIGAALDPIMIATFGGMGRLAASILDEAGLPAIEGLETMAWRGTPPLTRQLKKPAAHRLFVLGDAAGYAEPFTGEGMAWAMAQAIALAPVAAHAARRWEPVMEQEWTLLHAATVNRHQHSCRTLTRLLRRSSLTGALINILALFPSLATPLVNYFSSSATTRKAMRA